METARMTTQSLPRTPRTNRFLAAVSGFFIILVSGFLAAGLPAVIAFPAALLQAVVAGVILIRHPGMSSFHTGREAVIDVLKMLALGLLICGLAGAALYLVLQRIS
jgi:hypothetical protein